MAIILHYFTKFGSFGASYVKMVTDRSTPSATEMYSSLLLRLLRALYTTACCVCVLRVIYTECPVTCPCGEMCSNQRIQRREWLSRCLEKFLTDDRGFGVRTTQAISAGT